MPPLESYAATVSITAFAPDRHIEWTILTSFLNPQIGHFYCHSLEPSDGGSSVTSDHDWSRIDPVWKERAIFPILSETNLRATLGILARTVAPNMPRPIRTA